jgi:hypothetical protein
LEKDVSTSNFRSIVHYVIIFKNEQIVNFYIAKSAYFPIKYPDYILIQFIMALSEYEVRKAKAVQLKEMGIIPYANKFDKKHTI